MDQNILWGLFLVGIGFFLFFKGFKQLKRKRIIEDIPTSTIRGLAMGLVEIVGNAMRHKTLLKSPLSKTSCVFFKYQIDRYEKSGKSSRWVKIAGGDSGFLSFYVVDKTGRILITPHGAQYIMPEDYKYKTGSFGAIPTNLENFLIGNKISYKGFFGMKRQLRFREWNIREDDPVYILGRAQKSSLFYHELRDKMKKIVTLLKTDPVRRSRIDLNKDGKISKEEWHLAEKRIQKVLLEKAIHATGTGDVSDVVISKGDSKEPFIISDQSQKYLTKHLTLTSSVWIVIGSIMAVVGLGLLVYALGQVELFNELMEELG